MQNFFQRRVKDYVVRMANSNDLPHVISINWLTLPEHYSDFFFEELLKENPETFLVAEKDGTPVGYVMCRVEYGFSTTRRFGLARKGHIVSVAVLQEHRRVGLGRALVEEALKGMRNRGCSETYLEVRLSNTDAIKLYENMGFHVVSTLQTYYRDGEAALLMSLSLQ